MTLHNTLLTNNQFLVFIGDDTSQSFSFSKITNIQNTMEYDTVLEGGNNQYAYALPKPKSQVETIILEKGVPQKAEADLVTKFKVGTRLDKGMDIIVLKQEKGEGSQYSKGSVARAYGFHSGIITKWELNSLDAMGNEILINKVEIAHTGLYEIETGSGKQYTIS